MRFNEPVRKLESAAWILMRTGKSSLRIFTGNGERLDVHYHGTAEATLQKAGRK